MICREVNHHLIANRDEIATNGPIEWSKLDPLGGRFDGSASREVNVRVVAQQGHIRNFTSGSVPARNIIAHTDTTFGSDTIHIRDVGCLQWCFAA